jgi:hypothetical protein
MNQRHSRKALIYQPVMQFFKVLWSPIKSCLFDQVWLGTVARTVAEKEGKATDFQSGELIAW